MDAAEIADMVASEAGWTDATLLGVVLDYVNNQGSNDAFEDYLRERADTGDDNPGCSCGMADYGAPGHDGGPEV